MRCIGAECSTLATLEASGAVKHFDDGRGSRRVPAPVRFTLESGRTTALWGPSGSGKSTLLELIAGILVPDEGTIRFCGTGGETFEVSRAPERQRVLYRRRHLGIIFQFFNLVPTLTVAENVMLPLALNRLADPGSALRRLETLGIAECGDRFPETLSGGEQQRVAIARALAHEPAILLADEPTGNLDADNAETVTDLLWREAKRSGCGLVVATHDRRIAERADEVVALE